MDPLIHYLQEGTQSEDKAKVRKLKYWSALFMVLDRKLYKWAHLMPLYFLHPSKAGFAFREIYEGICKNMGGCALAYKIL